MGLFGKLVLFLILIVSTLIFYCACKVGSDYDDEMDLMFLDWCEKDNLNNEKK